MKDTGSCCKTVLVVEDDDGILMTLQELLATEGYRVALARNGKEAIEVLGKVKHPCLILLDMFMPVMDGWEFLDQLRLDGNDRLINVPIVITSAAGDQAKEAAKQVHGFIKKPIDLELLLTTVKKYCGPSLYV